jgi:hypothetical protein
MVTLKLSLQIKCAISSWVHKFTDTAEKALATEFVQQDLEMAEERADFIQKLLRDATNMSDKKHPFIWETAYDDPSVQLEVLSIVYFCHGLSI